MVAERVPNLYDEDYWQQINEPPHHGRLRLKRATASPLIQTIIIPVPVRTSDRITSVVQYFFAGGDMRSYEGDLGYLPDARKIIKQTGSWPVPGVHEWIADCTRYVTRIVSERVRHHELYESFAGLFPNLLYTYAPAANPHDATFLHGVPGVHPDWWPDIKTILDDVHRVSDF